jgi:geranylgeranyl diphosphate synthase, type II
LSRAAPAGELDSFLAHERAAIDLALGRATTLESATPALRTVIRYAVSAGGKRLRPVLCVAAFRATGDGASRAPIYDVAAAIELIHTYSLIHDDLPCMDDAELRRGQAAAHRKFGVRHATLAGAALIGLAVETLNRGALQLGLADPEALRLIHELCTAAGAGGMVGGQVLDLQAEGRRLSRAELEALQRAKTGALLTASLRIGALAARARAESLQALTRYGACIGLAFQITDDLLDLTGQPARTGKEAGADLQQAKATFPALLGTDGARRRARTEAHAAIRALRRANIDAPVLEALALYAVERDH